jgi:hypothetical protein
VGLERHHGRFQLEFARCLNDARKQCLVAAVDTVKVADRKGAWRTRPVVGKTAKNLHGNNLWLGRNTRLYSPRLRAKKNAAQKGGVFANQTSIDRYASGRLMAMIQ